MNDQIIPILQKFHQDYSLVNKKVIYPVQDFVTIEFQK